MSLNVVCEQTSFVGFIKFTAASFHVFVVLSWTLEGYRVNQVELREVVLRSIRNVVENITLAYEVGIV